MSKVTVLMPKRRLTTLWRRDALGPNAHNKPGKIPWRGLQENCHKYSSRKFFHDLRSQQNKIEMLERIISVKDDEIKKYKEMIINLKIGKVKELKQKKDQDTISPTQKGKDESSQTRRKSRKISNTQSYPKLGCWTSHVTHYYYMIDSFSCCLNLLEAEVLVTDKRNI
ncbi:hypothetical protein RhiirA4_480286 [Rhizophagus irregularis]|uniref:Uncharacterized protein n=1 Tax=Rhizophagus irregularis TaxID=588596 RepID=A0A2I1HHQ1_9GLOM|nr:hypothetical protein RhiirA4_480286 [Rhizophagus irregularis]